MFGDVHGGEAQRGGVGGVGDGPVQVRLSLILGVFCFGGGWSWQHGRWGLKFRRGGDNLGLWGVCRGGGGCGRMSCRYMFFFTFFSFFLTYLGEEEGEDLVELAHHLPVPRVALSSSLVFYVCVCVCVCRRRWFGGVCGGGVVVGLWVCVYRCEMNE